MPSKKGLKSRLSLDTVLLIYLIDFLLENLLTINFPAKNAVIRPITAKIILVVLSLISMQAN